MDYEEMRLECLRLAIEAGHKGQDAIDTAKKFYDHCRERSGMIANTRAGGEFDLPKRGAQIGLPQRNAHVTVHGKDGDLGKFTDYVRDPADDNGPF